MIASPGELMAVPSVFSMTPSCTPCFYIHVHRSYGVRYVSVFHLEGGSPGIAPKKC